MTLPSVLSSFLTKETLTIAGLILALAVAIATILKYRAEIRKLRAETKKIESDALAAERDKRKSERERVRDCAGNIIRSVSAMVDELFATFSPFAHPPGSVDKAKLDEAILVARRFRHEQRYRTDIERLISEFAALGARRTDPAIARLQAKATALLVKVSDKKIHVAKIEAEGLNRETAAGVASWLGEVRDLGAELGSLVGDFSGRLSLAPDDEEKIDRAA